MPTHLELATLSKQVYFKDGGYCLGWTCRAYYQDDSGLAAAAYENMNNEMVIAFRGTDTSDINNFLNNIITNFQLFLGGEIYSAKAAETFVKTIREGRTNLKRFVDFLNTRASNQLYLTGHSLGGALAQRVGAAMMMLGKEYVVITFENPGIAHYLTAEELKTHAAKLHKLHLTYVVDPNLINTLHPHVGTVRRLHVKPYHSTFFSKGMYYKRHITDCFFNEIIRLLLFLMLLNYLLQQIMDKQYISEFFANSTATLSKHAFGSALNPNDFLNFVIFVFKTLLIDKGLTKTLEVTSRQHTIDAIIAELTKGKGMPSQYTDMAQWPTHKGYLLSLAQHQLVNWLHPLKGPGLLTLTKATELHENSVKNTYGYKERSRLSRVQ